MFCVVFVQVRGSLERLADKFVSHICSGETLVEVLVLVVVIESMLLELVLVAPKKLV